MMKRFVRWGVVLSICTASSFAHAESPWGRADGEWNGSFLSSNRYYTARRMQETETPQAPALDTESLPSPSDAMQGSGLRPDPLPLQSATSATPTGIYGSGSMMEYSVGSEPCTTCNTGECATESCVDGSCFAASPCGCCPWYGGVYGLVMKRRDNFATYLSYESGMPSMPVLTTNSTDNSFGPGVEARLGRYLNECWAVEAGYWGFYPDKECTSVFTSNYAGDLSSALGYDGLSYNSGARTDMLDYWYGTPGNPAQMHQLARSFQAHNVEINFVRNPYRRAGCVHFELLAGVRYLRLDDGLMFSTDYTGTMFGDDPNNELHHTIDVQNDLIGFQIGGRADRYIWNCLGVHIGSKLGIYNNHMTHTQRIYGGNGTAYVTGNPNEFYDINTSDDDIAFVGELFAGVNYDIGSCWRLTGGYRAVSACGVGLATSQFPRDREFASVARSSQINSGDCLLLHGAYFGVEYNW